MPEIFLKHFLLFPKKILTRETDKKKLSNFEKLLLWAAKIG